MTQTIYIVDGAKRVDMPPARFEQDDCDQWLLPVTHISAQPKRPGPDDAIPDNLYDEAPDWADDDSDPAYYLSGQGASSIPNWKCSDD